MLMVIPDAGKALWLTWALSSDGSDFEDFVITLFQNDYVPDDDSVVADFDDADFDGADPIILTRADFTDPTTTAHVAESEGVPAPEWTFGAGSPQTVYGWYMIGADSNTVLAAQRFDTARIMNVGATEKLDPFKFKLKTFA